MRQRNQKLQDMIYLTLKVLRHSLCKNRKVAEETNKEIVFTKPRDLYNRHERLKIGLERVNGLPNPDKDDILKHVQYLTDNRRAALTILRNISVLIT